jgi:hypothetical protein
MVIAILCGSMLALAGCYEKYHGRVRATREQLIGVYETKFDNGTERLELKSDGTYVQEFTSAQKPFRHTGRWLIDDHFLGGTDLELIDAVEYEIAVEGSIGRVVYNPQQIGTAILNVHKHSEKIALAFNEAFDLYYERIR